jgi:hypothetical protein
MAWALIAGPGLAAQSLTTVAIRGTVHSTDGVGLDGARVSVVNAATGLIVQRDVSVARFLVQGLEVGGPYTVGVQRIGFHPQRRDGVYLHLGEPLELHFVLQRAAIPLDTVSVSTSTVPGGHGGTVTIVPDSLLHRLPTLNRNLYDFVRLAPQISTKIGFAPGGMAGGGVGFRFNNFLIDGVPQRSIAGSQPLEFSGGKTLPFEAVSEYQLLVAPFDPAYGDFAGAMVNAVTRSGRNELEGSVFAYGRTDELARHDELTAGSAYERLQYGLSLGGPIRRDRAHFFVAAELQHLTAPAVGPYVGQPPGSTPPVPVSGTDLALLSDIMQGYGLVAGSGGPVETRNPLANVFTRVDLAVPRFDSRLVLSANYARSKTLPFARPARGAFPLSTFSTELDNRTWTAALQLHTALRRRAGGHNQLVLSYGANSFGAFPAVRQPIVNVRVPATTGGAVTIMTGTPQQAQGNDFRPLSSNINVRNDLTIPLGASHVGTVGVEAQWFRVESQAVLNSYGTWIFSSLDSLEAGVAERFEVRHDFGSAGVPISGAQLAVYASDEWRAGAHLSLTMGIRADVLSIRGHAPYNAEIDSIFGRRTDEMPPPRLHLSPRLGFTWSPSGTERDRLRGGLGIFTGRPPVAWLHSALSAHGVAATLRCGPLPNDLGAPPAFVPDYRTPPETCANGARPNGGDVDLLDSDLGMVQTLRAVLAYDRRLPWDLLGTIEALITRNLSDFVFVNLNLAGPQAVDRFGRVLYGTVGSAGFAEPVRKSSFSGDVTELRNTSSNQAYQLAGRLEKRFSDGFAATAHYTFSRVRDVQTPLRVNTLGIVNWASRAVSGHHDDLSRAVSLNDIPHRIVIAGTARAPWRRWPTELSLYYVGESGSPFTYLAWGAVRGRGDLNADGSNENDPIYIPRSALDTAQIRFALTTRQVSLPGGGTRTDTITAMQQAEAFERFIEDTPCLRGRRGQILERNGCREPWSHTTVASLRQTIPIANDALQAQLDVYNVLNLLHSDWGRYRVAAPALLEQVGRTAGPPELAQPIFRYNLDAPRWTTLPAESVFQLQFALRYRF